MRDLWRILRAGWLTPGSEILFRLENRKILPESVLRRSYLLQRKWFSELDCDGKSKWIRLFWDFCKKDELPKVLGLSKRRLSQLIKAGNPFPK